MRAVRPDRRPHERLFETQLADRLRSQSRRLILRDCALSAESRTVPGHLLPPSGPAARADCVARESLRPAKRVPAPSRTPCRSDADCQPMLSQRHRPGIWDTTYPDGLKSFRHKVVDRRLYSVSVRGPGLPVAGARQRQTGRNPSPAEEELVRPFAAKCLHIPQLWQDRLQAAAPAERPFALIERPQNWAKSRTGCLPGLSSSSSSFRLPKPPLQFRFGLNLECRARLISATWYLQTQHDDCPESV